MQNRVQVNVQVSVQVSVKSCKKNVDYPCPFNVFCFMFFLGFMIQANFRDT